MAGSVQVNRCLLERIVVTGTTPQFRLKTLPSIKARRELILSDQAGIPHWTA